MPRPDITVSIVTYNSEAVIRNCLDSIIQGAQECTFEILIVDNASTDGSCKLIRQNFPQVTLVENTENVGFGRAHNQAFKLAKGDALLILNPDTLVFPGTLDRMYQFMQTNARAGAIGCRIWWDDEKNFMFPDLKIHSLSTAFFNLTPFCRYFPNSFLSRNYWRSAHRLWSSGLPVTAEGITGGIMMVRRDAFESAGLFDENFFLFFEEHDLLRLIKKTGWEIYYLPEAEIQHYFEESVRNSTIDISAVYRESALYYYKKHYKKPGYYFARSLMALNKILLSLESAFTRPNKHIYPEVRPVDGRLIIKWPSDKKAKNYIVEVSYSPEFCDRGGNYVQGETLSLSSDVLKRLPDETGYIRVLPVYKDNSVGKVIRIVKITK